MTPSLSLRVTSARHGVVPILGAIAFDLFPGETAVLTGPSGIGKTTLLRIVAGLHRDWQGEIIRPGHLAMVFQDPTLLPWRSVLDNIILPTKCTPEAAHALLEDVGLAPLRSRYPRSLSLGQQRRLALARAFAMHPQVLLMDEPFVSLDPSLVGEMIDLFTRLRGNSPVATLMVTHSEDEANALASRVLRLSGQPATLTADAPTLAQKRGVYFQLSASGVALSRS